MTVKEKPTAVTVDDRLKQFNETYRAALLCEAINSSNNKDYNTKDPKEIFKKLYKYYGGAK
jgi:hypothetical protein